MDMIDKYSVACPYDDDSCYSSYEGDIFWRQGACGAGQPPSLWAAVRVGRCLTLMVRLQERIWRYRLGSSAARLYYLKTMREMHRLAKSRQLAVLMVELSQIGTLHPEETNVYDPCPFPSVPTWLHYSCGLASSSSFSVLRANISEKRLYDELVPTHDMLFQLFWFRSTE
jgi:hypothetical protein